MMAAEKNQTQTSPSEPSCLKAALDYAARGWQVVPLHWPDKGKCSCGKPDCQSPAKHPLTPHGLKDASTNPAVIRHWWEKWPKANVAVITGAKSGLVVLDIDKNKDGFDSLKKMERKGNLPLTPQVSTGGGGRHYFLAHNGKLVRNKAGLAGLSGIDVRGDGGYVVAPPSRHMSGDSYSWDYKPETTGLAAIPAWLYEMLQEDTQRQAGAHSPPTGLNQWSRLWHGVDKGGRNDAASRLAGRLLGRGLPHEEARLILDAWNTRNTPPLSSQELSQVIASISRSEAQKPQNVGVMPAEFFLTAEIDRPPIIIAEGILFEASSLMITGASGVGKSLLTLELAICLSKGLPWLGMEIPDPRQVLFIQAENPDFALQSRLRRLCHGMDIKHLPKIHFCNREFRADINQVRDRKKIGELIEKTNAQIVILDPLSSYHQVNENDNIQMRRALDNLTEISAVTKCAWIVVHHEGKPGDSTKENAWRFRGASSIRDWADAMIGLIEKGDESRVLRILSFDKIRMGKKKLSLMLERDKYFVHHITDEDAMVPMTLIAECLAEMGGKTRKNALVRQISKYVECSDRTIYRAVEFAENKVYFMSDKWLMLIGKY